MKLIPLSLKSKTVSGKYFAKVDDEDYDFLMQWKWSACKSYYSDDYYALRSEMCKGKTQRFSMHRVILALALKNTSKIYDRLDHINQDTLDNQKHNLRIASRSQNRMNSKSLVGASKFKGVRKRLYPNGTFNWRACIGLNKETIHLGCFPGTSEGEIIAAKRYDMAAKYFHGEFANLNFKEDE